MNETGILNSMNRDMQGKNKEIKRGKNIEITEFFQKTKLTINKENFVLNSSENEL